MTQQELLGIKQRFGIIGQSPLLNRDIEIAVQVARTDLSVLITGESGVGKEHFPKIIHAFSARKHGAYFAVNCGAIPEGTIDSELFGHEKGAFTDAKNEHKGYFEIADGGTLFLDEVGELPLQTQVRLLRVLETGEFLRMGSSQVRKTNVRVVAATNLNMVQAIKDGRFREDLYYRLNTVEIRVPALRERKEDIPLLFRKFASDFSEKYNVCKVSLSHDAILMLQNYRWPGNIRQLKNAAESISAMESKPLTAFSERVEIDAATLSRYLPKEDPNTLPVIAGPAQQDAMNASEKQMLIKAILDLKQEVDQLKATVYGGAEPPHSLVGAVQDSIPAPVREPLPHPAEEAQEAEWQESEVHESGSLDIRKTEQDNIRRALEKHHGNRKLAAAELGISERTLYRRLSKE